MTGLIDSHCHLDVEQFDADRPAMLARAAEAGVVQMVVPGIALAEMPRVIALAAAHPQIFIGVGVHPHEAHTWQGEVADRLRAWASHPKVVAIGEIGLDHYYPEPPRATQEACMRAQVQLARELGKPVIVHDRDAHDATLQLLKEELDPQVGGVMHCFSGNYAFALECIALGMMISFAGPVTFKNAADLHEAATRLPLDRLLVETDSPYLAPVPHRGQRNEPANVVHVAAKIAALRGISVDEVRQQTAANTRRLFKLPAAD